MKTNIFLSRSAKALMLLLLTMSVTTAQAAKHFYDAKSNIIGITGDLKVLTDGFENKKFVENNNGFRPAGVYNADKTFNGPATEKALNDANVGKQVLNYLFMRTADGKMSEDLLKDRAVKNAQLADRERAQAGLIDAATIVREDYISILKNNYIFLADKIKLGDNVYYNWALFHVEIDEKTQDDVFAAWEDPARYDAIKVKVRFIAAKRSQLKSYNKVLRDVSRCEDALAIRGAVLKDPYCTDINNKSGLKRNDRMSIYRQYQNADGTYYSKYMGHTRIMNPYKYKDKLPMAGISGNSGSEKKGDFAVFSPDLNWSHAVYYGIKGKNISYGYQTEIPLRVSLLPLAERFIFRAEMGEFRGDKESLYLMKGNLYHTPRTYTLTAGFGKPFYMLNRVDLMPFYTLGYHMIKFKGYESKAANSSGSKASSGGFLGTIGLRLAINLWYPVQLMGSVEYQYHFPFESKNDDDPTKITWKTVENNFYDAQGWKFNNVNFMMGLRIVL